MPPPTPFATAAASVKLFDCSQLAPEPWANGGGITRTIARSEQDRGKETDWRVSVATLNGPAKFSQFFGFDRTLLLIDDSAVDLHSQDGQLAARRGQPVHFSGDLHVWSTLSTKPVNVLNVMTRRGKYRSSVNIVTNSSRLTSAPIHLLIGLSGQWSVRSALLNSVPLAPLQGALIAGRREPMDLSPTGSGSELMSIAIEPVDH
jgi:environmental stress-induced protein Ves